MGAEVTVEPTQYTVCALPHDNVNFTHYAITVDRVMSRRGVSGWAVRRLSECLGADGEWDYEPSPSSRTDEWIATHRFDLETALDLAQKAAPRVIVNGFTVADAIERAARARATS